MHACQGLEAVAPRSAPPQAFKYATATDGTGAAADGVETGRAISAIPFGDVNVVTDVLTAALSQRRIDKPGGKGPSKQEQPPPGPAAGPPKPSPPSNGTSSPGQPPGAAAADANTTSAERRAAAARAYRQAALMRAEYDYWNGYLTPFYNHEYDMAYDTYDYYGPTADPDHEPPKLRTSPAGGGSQAAAGGAAAGGRASGATPALRTGAAAGGGGGRGAPGALTGANFTDAGDSYLYDPLDVLMATTLEYGRAGQYYYRFLGSYYTGPNIVPQTAKGSTRSTTATVRDDRASTAGSSQQQATGLNVATVVQSVSAAIRGVSQSLRQKDVLGEATFTGAPQQPTRTAGVVVGGLTFGRGYFFTAPSASSTQASTSASVGGGGGVTAGALGQVTGYGTGTKFSGARSQIGVVGAVENFDFDIAG
ncbi:hypothetical protein HYH03_003593 [Edaphochlamys debaryana]|uniref:Uncharacterized protein n=1 Tax=Edaphochlamys debaryana TaxID=47281 RepID=A0A835Y955_9CHLO|nr:hypothetical protein HYH03_003593 [Edaphochlamys debaryana]|eukprot:KAG2498333.1 hypothetical protein HYH03_003593 [Edaphochlamys debaryana]